MKFLIPRLHPVDKYLAWAVCEKGYQLDIIGSFSDGEGWLEEVCLETEASYFHIDSHQASGLSADDYLEMYHDRLAAHVKKHGIDCILPSAATDMILRSIGRVNDKFDLPGIREAAAILFTNKNKYLFTLAKHGVLGPRPEDIVMPGKEPNFYDLPYPVISKPNRGTGSKGIFVSQNEADHRWFFGPSDRPQDFSENAARIHDRMEDGSLRNYLYHGEGGAYIVEPFIQGPCISIGGTVDDDGLKIDCIHKVDVTPLPYRSETGYRFSPEVSGELRMRSQELAEKMDAALPFPTGAWRADCIWTDSELSVVDVAPRMCTTASEALAFSTHRNQDYANGILESIVHGQRMTKVAPKWHVRCKVLDLPKGKIKDVLEPEDEEVEFAELPSPGTQIYEARNDLQSWSRGYILSVGRTMEEASAEVDAYISNLVIEME